MNIHFGIGNFYNQKVYLVLSIRFYSKLLIIISSKKTTTS